VTAGVTSPAVLLASGDTSAGSGLPEHPSRPMPMTWPQTEQPREELLERLSKPLFQPDSDEVRRAMRRGLTALLDWLDQQPGVTWQDRWLASGAEAAGPAWTDLVPGGDPSMATRPARHARTDLLSAMRLMLTGQVLRPGYPWLLRYRPSVLLEETRRRIDPAGFARLLAHCDATGRRNPLDRKNAVNRIAWILLNKGGQIRDITVGDCIELNNALREHQCNGASNRPLFYALLAEVGVLPAGAPPMLRATQMSGQRTPAELVGKYGLQNPSIRDLFVSYLAERAAELDYASLVHLASALCGLFWRDLEQHHPGIASLQLDAGIAATWKERLRQVRDHDGRLVGDRATVRSQLLIVRAFYLDIARWAAEDPSRWARWATPCPVKASECSMEKERKHRKAAMDQRTRARLPVLPALVRTAEQQRTAARARLDAALAVTPGEVFHEGGGRFMRRPNAAGRIYVTDLADGQRRDLTFEEERAFWGRATIEVLRHTGAFSRGPKWTCGAFFCFGCSGARGVSPWVRQVWWNSERCACGWVALPAGARQRRRAVALIWAMSSRLAARAAASSSSRSSSWRRRSAACCSRWVIFWLSASMSAGAPSPESFQACSPRVSESRFSSCRMRALRRAARSWAASRSVCSDVRVTAGQGAASPAAGAASVAWIWASRSRCR